MAITNQLHQQQMVDADQTMALIVHHVEFWRIQNWRIKWDLKDGKAGLGLFIVETILEKWGMDTMDIVGQTMESPVLNAKSF